MRKFIGIILCVATVLSLCACGDSKSSTVNSGTKSASVATADKANTPTPAEDVKEYFYITVDKSVGLCDYHKLTYNKYDTTVKAEEVDEKLQSTLEYFQSFMEVTELTDELIDEYFDDYSTVEELRQAYGKILQEKKEEERIAYIRDAILQELVSESDVFTDYSDLATETYNSLMQHYDAMAVIVNKSLDEYVEENFNTDIEKFKLSVAEDAKTLTLRRMLLLAVAESEGLQITEEEYANRIQNYMEYYGYDKQEVFEYEYTHEFIIQNMLNDLALEYLLTVAVEV